MRRYAKGPQTEESVSISEAFARHKRSPCRFSPLRNRRQNAPLQCVPENNELPCKTRLGAETNSSHNMAITNGHNQFN